MRAFCLLLTLAGGVGNAAGARFMDFVPIGDVGNAADTTGYGGVNYQYQIGTYEVTNTQYALFLNAVATTADPYSLYNDQGAILRSSPDLITFSYSVKPGLE